MKTIRSFLVALNLVLLTPSLLYSNGTIAGKVIAPEDALLKGTVSLRRRNCFISSADIKKDGSFSFPKLQPGSYTVIANIPGCQTYALGTYLQDKQINTLTFTVKETGCYFTGTVAAKDSNDPISDANVRIFLDYNLISETKTDASGAFSFTDVPPGNYQLVINNPHYQAAASGIIIKYDHPLHVQMLLASNPGSLSGTVINKGNKKVMPGASISVIDGPAVLAFTTADANGHFSLQGLPPGGYTVIAESGHYQAASVGCYMKEGEDAAANFSLITKSCTINGRVTNEESHESLSAVVTAYNAKQTFVMGAITDSKGFYTLSNLAPGTYNITVKAPHFQGQTKSSQAITTSASQLDFALKTNPCSVTGTVRDDLTKKPLAGISISVYEDSLFIAAALTDERGHYQFNNLRPGTYRLTTTYALFQGSEHVVSVSSDAETALDFTLHAYPGSIEGTIRDESTNEPIQGASIVVEDHAQIQQTLLTDKDGQFTLTGLMPGKYRVTATADSYQFSIQTILVYSSKSTTAPFTLKQAPAVVKGLVVDESHEPLVGAYVSITAGEAVVGQALTDTNGFYYLGNLQPGHYQMIVEAKNYQPTSLNVSVTTNAETTRDFTVKAKPAVLSGTVIDALSGNRITDAHITLLGTKGYSKILLSDQNGDFTFEALAPDTYTIEASALKCEKSVTTFKISPEQKAQLILSLLAQKPSISCDSVDATTDKVLAGAEVSLLQDGKTLSTLHANEHGHFEIFDLAPGTYTLMIKAKGYAVKSESAAVLSDKSFSSRIFLTELASPLHVHGAIVLDRYLTTTDRIHSLSWQPSPSEGVVKYNLYRNGTFVTSLNAGSALKYDFHRQSGKEVVAYTITALKENGEESLPFLCNLK